MLNDMHSYGLLRGSFRPNAQIATLRAYLRQRERLVEYAAAHIQHMQKALIDMNLQLHHVVSDITGVTGMRIIRAIVAGERDPDVLASLRDIRCHSSVETIRVSLVGNDRDEHIFALSQSLDLYDFYQQKMLECDRKLEQAIATMAHNVEKLQSPLPKIRTKTKQPNTPSFEVQAALYGLVGTDLTQIHTLYIVALPGSGQQDIWRQTSFVKNAPIIESGGRTLAVGCYHDWPKRHSTGCVLPTFGRAYRQAESSDGDCTQDRRALLQRASLRHGLS